ncbi:MAG: [FeFe] hydrogenase H-cluster radical SAM maturase HydG [Clostridiales bacterium]
MGGIVVSGFIVDSEINKILDEGKNYTKDEIKEIILKAKECKGLTIDDVSKLLYIDDDFLLNDIFDTAKYVKNKIYGKRVVLFAPLYTSNECTNNCLYCGFRRDNKNLHRKTLDMEQIVDEAKTIEDQGHKRILLICGEDKNKTGGTHLAEAMKEIYKNTGIRRINVEAAPMTVEEYRYLKEAGIGTYVIFQETYNRKVYKKMHPTGTKSNYDWRINSLDRAFEAGIDDLGLGALLGLNDYKYEVIAILKHVEYLEKKFKVGPHTISVPRLRPAFGWGLDEIPYKVNDEDFKKIVAIYRLAVPYTGIILSTRESAELRDELLDLGVSQISAGSRTNPGGYEKDDDEADQFEICDERTLPKVIESICDNGYIPSFCTACYRRCRTGEKFMEFAKEAEIHEFCQPNAILTFKENLIDYSKGNLREKGENLIKKALKEIDNDKLKEKTLEKLKEIENGKRDIYF